MCLVAQLVITTMVVRLHPYSVSLLEKVADGMSEVNIVVVILIVVPPTVQRGVLSLLALIPHGVHVQRRVVGGQRLVIVEQRGRVIPLPVWLRVQFIMIRITPAQLVRRRTWGEGSQRPCVGRHIQVLYHLEGRIALQHQELHMPDLI